MSESGAWEHKYNEAEQRRVAAEAECDRLGKWEADFRELTARAGHLEAEISKAQALHRGAVEALGEHRAALDSVATALGMGAGHIADRIAAAAVMCIRAGVEHAGALCGLTEQHGEALAEIARLQPMALRGAQYKGERDAQALRIRLLRSERRAVQRLLMEEAEAPF